MIDEIVKASESKDDFMSRISRRMQRKEVPFSSSSSHLGTLWNKPNTQKLKAICFRQNLRAAFESHFLYFILNYSNVDFAIILVMTRVTYEFYFILGNIARSVKVSM